MKKSKHFIITRFNISQSFQCKARQPEKNLLEKNLEREYLRKRFEIFRRYTLPSIEQQTNQNFDWIVLFHKQTPTEFLKQIEEIKEQYDKFNPIFLQGNEMSEVNRYILENSNECDFYLTSRIDNDDAYALDYIEKIQQYTQTIHNIEPVILSFSQGFQYDISNNMLVPYYYLENHFTSMISTKNSRYKNIYELNHAKILQQQNIPVINLEKEPMWLEIIHETNYINHLKSQKEIRDMEKILRKFGIAIEKAIEENTQEGEER